MPLPRRGLLRVVASITPVAAGGCIETDGELIFHEDERLVTVTVAEGFPGDVVIDADCREADVTVAPRERVRLHREEDGEECFIRLVADGEELLARDIWDYEAPELMVEANGG